MRISNQSKPVERSKYREFEYQSETGMQASQCPDGTEVGRCFFSDSGPIDGFNCPACCALRTAVSWYGAATGAVIC